jgi:hypothetical protein
MLKIAPISIDYSSGIRKFNFHEIIAAAFFMILARLPWCGFGLNAERFRGK